MKILIPNIHDNTIAYSIESQSTGIQLYLILSIRGKLSGSTGQKAGLTVFSTPLLVSHTFVSSVSAYQSPYHSTRNVTKTSLAPRGVKRLFDRAQCRCTSVPRTCRSSGCVVFVFLCVYSS